MLHIQIKGLGILWPYSKLYMKIYIIKLIKFCQQYYKTLYAMGLILLNLPCCLARNLAMALDWHRYFPSTYSIGRTLNGDTIENTNCL